MQPLQPNPETGFLESKGQFVFDSSRKVKLLEIAREMRAKGKWPDIYSLCEAVGISYNTFNDHMQVDENFKRAWNEVKMSAATALESQMYDYAQRPNGYMHMITWLRKNVPEDWNPDLKVQITSDSVSAKGLIEGAKNVFEAEIVPNSENIPAIKPQDNEKY